MPSADLFQLVGTIVDGRYRVDAVAGRGGCGIVYRAFHLTFESTVALKVLKVPAHLTADERRAKTAQFRREGKVLFELSRLHPAIVKAFEAGIITGGDGTVAPYLAMEWLDGAALSQELKHRRDNRFAPMTLREIVALLDPAARALALVHSRGVAHRDIKPGNLFVGLRAGRPSIRLLDFGIAKILDDSLSTTARLEVTSDVRSSFTAMYGAPEQWLRRFGATGPWTDVHAMALVCVELLTLSAPFAGDDPAALMAACVDADSRPTPKTLGLDLGPEVEAVFARGLAVRPNERFRDMDEFWSALRDSAQPLPEPAADPVLRWTMASPIGTGAPEVVSSSERSFEAFSTAPTATTAQGSRPRRGKSSGLRRVSVLGMYSGVVVVLGLALIKSTSKDVVATASSAEVTEHIAAEAPTVMPSDFPPPVIEIAPQGTEGVRQLPAAATPPRVDKILKPLWTASAAAAYGTTTAAAPVRAPAQGEFDVGSPDAGATTVDHSAPNGSRQRSSTTLEQLMKNEELVHRR